MLSDIFSCFHLATEILNMYWHGAACLLVLDASVPLVSHSTLYDVYNYKL